MRIKNLLLVVPITAALAFGVAACGDSSSDSGDSGSSAPSSDLSGQLAGAGSSAQEAAMQAWIATFQQSNPDITLSYDPVGSGGGREQFISGAVPFGGTDSAMDETELPDAQKQCGGVDNYVEIPIYISPIAAAYNVDGVDDLNLSAATLGKIFNGKITNWNDPAIASENPDATLPDLDITTVHRSDESGTTDNFTGYLSAAAPKDWPYEADGNWPIKGGEAASGTSGVISAIKSGSGTIGYADLSQIGDLGAANIKVGSEFVTPSSEAAAKIIDISKEVPGEGKYIFAFDLNRTTKDSSIYPISLVSYEMACTHYDKASDGEAVKAFYEFIASPEGQKVAAENAGSAPISSKLYNQIKPAIAAIGSN